MANYTITCMDMVHDEVMFTSNDIEAAKAQYALITSTFMSEVAAGKYGDDYLEDLEDGATIVLEDEDENVISEQTFYGE